MPTYEYKCRDSQHIYKETRGMTEDQRVSKCPECGSDLVRVFGVAAITFNGTGFASNNK